MENNAEDAPSSPESLPVADEIGDNEDQFFGSFCFNYSSSVDPETAAAGEGTSSNGEGLISPPKKQKPARGGARPGKRADGSQKQAKNWTVLDWEGNSKPTTIDGFWEAAEHHCSSHRPEVELPRPLLAPCNIYPNASQRAAHPNKNWSTTSQYEERRCGAANWYDCGVRFNASWIGPKDQPEWCEFYISGEHNSHRCVTFLVSTSIYKCFSSADAPDRSHGLAPHVKTKILELMECGIHKKAEILQRLKVAQVL